MTDIRTTAVMLSMVLMSTSCSTQQSLSVQRDRLPQAIERGHIQVDDGGGHAHNLAVAQVIQRPSPEVVDPVPHGYVFGEDPLPFPKVLQRWQTSDDWQVADVTVEVPPAENHSIAGTLIGCAAGALGAFGYLQLSGNDDPLADINIVGWGAIGAGVGAWLGATIHPRYHYGPSAHL